MRGNSGAFSRSPGRILEASCRFHGVINMKFLTENKETLKGPSWRYPGLSWEYLGPSFVYFGQFRSLGNLVPCCSRTLLSPVCQHHCSGQLLERRHSRKLPKTCFLWQLSQRKRSKLFFFLFSSFWKPSLSQNFKNAVRWRWSIVLFLESFSGLFQHIIVACMSSSIAWSPSALASLSQIFKNLFPWTRICAKGSIVLLSRSFWKPSLSQNFKNALRWQRFVGVVRVCVCVISWRLVTSFVSRLGLFAFTCVRLVHRVVPNPICPLAVGRKQVELHTPLILMLICGGCVAFWRFPKQRWKVDACLPLLRAFGVVVILWVASKNCGTQ